MAQMEQGREYQGRCQDEVDVTHVQEEEIYELYEREGKSPLSQDDKVFQVPESILLHPLAIPRSNI